VNIDGAAMRGTDNAPTAAEINTELTANHGAGSWQSSGASGSNAVTVTVEDDESALLDAKTTDALGQVAFALDDGTYKVRLRKAFVSFTVPETLVVSGATTETYEGVPFSATPPSPGMQTLYGYAKTISSVAAGGDTVTVAPQKQILDGQVISSEPGTATVDSDGYFEIALVQDAKVRIWIRHYNIVYYDKVVTVTTDSTRDIADYGI
jgi:hypothetical protein